MKIATWNVNSIRVRLEHLRTWLDRERPDFIALQEIKTVEADFPAAPLRELGYEIRVNGQKTYNGVAILSRHPMTLLATALPDFDDPQRRVLAVQSAGLTIVNLYVPNGSEVGSDKYDYKLAWLRKLNEWVRELAARAAPLIVLGDFNIALEDRDVHDPAAWAGGVLVSPPERDALSRLMASGLRDCFRLFEQPDGEYTWWDYRAGGFRRNHGLRIDLILANAAAVSTCRRCVIDKTPRRWQQPSDHAPVLAEFASP